MKKQHDGQILNLNAGYVPIPNLIDEKKVGLFGQNAKIFTSLIIFLLFIAVLNLVVSIKIKKIKFVQFF
jgi:hypothetical protein